MAAPSVVSASRHGVRSHLDGQALDAVARGSRDPSAPVLRGGAAERGARTASRPRPGRGGPPPAARGRTVPRGAARACGERRGRVPRPTPRPRWTSSPRRGGSRSCAPEPAPTAPGRGPHPRAWRSATGRPAIEPQARVALREGLVPWGAKAGPASSIASQAAPSSHHSGSLFNLPRARRDEARGRGAPGGSGVTVTAALPAQRVPEVSVSRWLGGVVSIAVMASAGCAAPREPGVPRVALVMKSLANEFFQTMEDGARSHESAHPGRYRCWRRASRTSRTSPVRSPSWSR